MIWAQMAWELPAGILILAIGGDMLVRGAAAVAGHLRVSSLFVGITLVGFGTSMPELVTSLRAALLEAPGIAVGNVIGSNTANIFLIIGISALIYPLATPRNANRRNGVALLIATMVCIAVVIAGRIDRPIGAVLIALLFAYFFYGYIVDRRAVAMDGDQSEAPGHIARALLLAAAGMVLVMLGARWLVDNALEIAREYAVSETIIGLTLVAVGTSLPELITSTVAAFRKETGIALGNVIGSNIQNILGILGVTAVVHPIVVPPEIIDFDIWVMAGATLALILFAISNWRISRLEGVIFLIAYTVYIGVLALIAFPDFRW